MGAKKMDRKLGIMILLVFCCTSCFAVSSPTIMTIGIPTSASYEYNHRELTVSDVNELIDIRYGSAVDRMSLFVSIWFGVLGLVAAVILGYIIKTGRKHNRQATVASNCFDSSKVAFDKLIEELKAQGNEISEILRLDFSLSLNTETSKSFEIGIQKGDDQIMRKLQVIEKNGSLSFEELLLKSAVLFRSAEYLESLNILKSMKTSGFTNSDILFKMGFCYQMLHQNADAESAYRQSISIDARNIGAYINLSKLLIDQGFPNKAIKYLQSAAAINPFHPGVMSGLMHAFMQQGKADAARSIFDIAQSAGVQDSYLAINKICLDALDGKYGDCYQPLLDYVDQHPDRITEVLTDSHLVELYKAEPTLKETIQDKLKAQKDDACI